MSGKPVSDNAASYCLVLRYASDLFRLIISISQGVADCAKAVEYLLMYVSAVTRSSNIPLTL
jgi:hypothetical protein